MSFLGVLSGDPALIQRFQRMTDGTESTLKRETESGGTLLMSATGHTSSLNEDPLPSTAQGPGSAPTEPGDRHSTAVWNVRPEELRLDRARVGVPPVFYWIDGDSLAWSTSMRPLLELGAPKNIDHTALAQYQLSGFVQGPRTMLSSIRKLPAGHRLTWRSGQVTVAGNGAHDWQPKATMDIEAQVEPVESMLTRSIQHTADAAGGRLGILLSGGIDSVCLAAIASRRTDAEIEAFTFEYSDYTGKFNEAGSAADVASRLGIHHEVVEISAEALVTDLPRLVGEYEEPFTYGVHSAYMQPIRERGMSAAITGAVGATWALTGAIRTATRLSRLAPGSLFASAAPLAAKLPGIGRRIGSGLRLAAMSDAQRYFAMTQQVVIPDNHLRMLCSDPNLVTAARDSQVASLEDAVPNGLNPADIFAAYGLLSFGAEHLTWWSHRWAEAAGISIAFPYMEDEYVNFLGRLRNRTPDSPERRLIARKYLPEDTAYAPKTPQTLPLDVWLAGPLQEFARDNLTKKAITDDGTFDYDVIESRMNEHFSGQGNHKWSIWTTLCYLIWKREFLDGVTVTR